MRFRSSLQAILTVARYAVLPFVVITAVVLAGFFFYWHGRTVMATEIKDKLRTATALAATQIDPTKLSALNVFADTKKPQYRSVVTALDAIRHSIPHIHYAYIMRPTAQPLMFAFVADADGLKTSAELDVNHNGIVDPDEEPGHPGDPYDISETPALQGITAPAVDPSFTTDQWGTFISGYAPIRDAHGNMVAILGLDMDASQFDTLSQQIFSPIALLLLVVVGVLMAAYVLIVIHQRRFESLRQLNADRAALMDLATHQLGAPLATFKWWIEILRDHQKAHRHSKADQKEDNEAFAELEEGLRRMDAIIVSMQNAMRLQNTRQSPQVACVSMRQILQKVPDTTMEMLARRKQTLAIKIPAQLCITVDPKLFIGVFQELIENASWYSPNKTTVTVHARKDRRHVTIDIEDQGYGIPAADLAHIFEQFQRGSTAMNHKPVGNGLGLSIIKNIVTSAGGTIAVRSGVNKGTVFTITLPAA